jgi:sugar fermentation stimulation protein A
VTQAELAAHPGLCQFLDFLGARVKYKKTLDEGVFIKRYKRFFADIAWQGQTLIAHVPNTGSMKGINNPGQPCLFSHSDNPERKLKQTLEMIKALSGAWVGVNTATPNAMVRETLEKIVATAAGESVPKNWSHWQGFSAVKAEHKISAGTRLDFSLSRVSSNNMHFIEVKNVTMAEGNRALFPDSETVRGQKHLLALMKLIDEGHTAEIIFTIQRADCESFSPAHDIDAEYGRLLRQAYDRGVRITPLVVTLSPDEAVLSERLVPVSF